MDERGGNRSTRPCVCQVAKRNVSRMAALGVPERYADESFATYKPTHLTQETALILARGFATEWPMNRGEGLTFVGAVGTGKTHLATCILRACAEKGATGIFVNTRDLLKAMRDSFNGKAGAPTEEEILRPVLRSDLAILDDVGAEKPSEWTFEQVEHIISKRYDASLSTLVTANYLFERAAPRAAGGYGTPSFESMKECLADRIGERSASRLQQMTRRVDLAGDDWRKRPR